MDVARSSRVLGGVSAHLYAEYVLCPDGNFARIVVLERNVVVAELVGAHAYSRALFCRHRKLTRNGHRLPARGIFGIHARKERIVAESLARVAADRIFARNFEVGNPPARFYKPEILIRID